VLLTYGQVKAGPCSKIAGVCATSPDFAGYVNQATRQLMRRGNFFGTVQPMRGCVYDNCITWPRQVGTVLAVNQNGHYTELSNRWYQFMPWAGVDLCSFGLGPGHWHQFRETTFDGTTPVFNPIPFGLSRYILAFPSVQADIGKTITLFGKDSNGQTVMQKMTDGTWQEGITLTLALPYTQTPMLFQKITRVVKDVTQGVVRLYQWDGVTLNPDGSANLSDCALYDPSETSPDYQHSRMSGCRNSNCPTGFQITALVKLAFFPVVNDNDLVLIENQDALAIFIQSIKYREKGDAARAVQWERDAFRELNYQMRDMFPDEQFTVNFRPFGNDGLNRITAGFL
jgi:hypothetical protein